MLIIIILPSRLPGVSYLCSKHGCSWDTDDDEFNAICSEDSDRDNDEELIISSVRSKYILLQKNYN